MATTSAAPHLASRLRLAVARTARRLRQEAGGGLSPTLTAALASIENHGPLTPSELADRERIKRPTATRLIGNLEENGLVVRASDPSDGRSSLIAITPEGRELVERATADLVAADFALSGLTDEQLEMLWSVLEPLRHNAGDFT